MKATFRLCVLMMGWVLLIPASWGSNRPAARSSLPDSRPMSYQSPEAPATILPPAR